MKKEDFDAIAAMTALVGTELNMVDQSCAGSGRTQLPALRLDKEKIITQQHIPIAVPSGVINPAILEKLPPPEMMEKLPPPVFTDAPAPSPVLPPPVENTPQMTFEFTNSVRQKQPAEFKSLQELSVYLKDRLDKIENDITILSSIITEVRKNTTKKYQKQIMPP